jgi:hypothetical protein
MRRSTAASVLLFPCLSLYAQVPQQAVDQPSQVSYSFKASTLGMTLEEFKIANAGMGVQIPFGQVDNKGKNKTVYRVVPLPICSDAYSAPVFDGTVVSGIGEIVCSMTYSNESTKDLVVAGERADRILYRFFGSRLCQIEIYFASNSYGAISEAFVLKYGSPVNESADQYQNVFGAHWVGQNKLWRNGKQLIAISEGANNGPGRNSDGAGGGIAVIFDVSRFAPQKPKVLDF